MFRTPQPPTRPSTQQAAMSAEPKRLPDPPVSPFVRYSRRMWQNVRSEMTHLQLWEISAVVKENWEKLADSEREIYQREYEVEMAQYEKALAQHNGSVAVQTAIKNRVKGGSKGKTEVGSSALVRNNTEEDEQPSELTSRRMHAVRFDRNHRLIADLFNSTAVFDSRLVVPQKRLDLLQKQAHNLELHKSKLEEELTKLEDAFAERKRRMQRSSEEFNEKLKKVVEDKVDVSDEKYEEMVAAWEGKLADAYEEYKKKREAADQRLAEEREKIAKSTPLLYAMTVGDEDPEGKDERKEEAKDEPVATTDGENSSLPLESEQSNELT